MKLADPLRHSTEPLVRLLEGFFLPLIFVVDLETSNGVMPAPEELMMLSRLLIVPSVEHARSEDHLGQFLLVRAEAQRVYGAASELHNERTRNTLKHSTRSHKLWEALNGSIFGVKLSIPALRGPGGGLVVAPAEKEETHGLLV